MIQTAASGGFQRTYSDDSGLEAQASPTYRVGDQSPWIVCPPLVARARKYNTAIGFEVPYRRHCVCRRRCERVLLTSHSETALMEIRIQRGKVTVWMAFRWQWALALFAGLVGMKLCGVLSILAAQQNPAALEQPAAAATQNRSRLFDNRP